MREEIWYFDKAVSAFVHRVEALAEDGVMAELELNGEMDRGGAL